MYTLKKCKNEWKKLRGKEMEIISNGHPLNLINDKCMHGLKFELKFKNLALRLNLIISSSSHSFHNLFIC